MQKSCNAENTILHCNNKKRVASRQPRFRSHRNLLFHSNILICLLVALASLPLHGCFFHRPIHSTTTPTKIIRRKNNNYVDHSVPIIVRRQPTTEARRATEIEPLIEQEWLPLLENLQGLISRSFGSSGAGNQTTPSHQDTLSEDEYVYSDDDADDESAIGLKDDITKRVARAAILKSRNIRSPSPSYSHKAKSTSVGARRDGSASRARQGNSKTATLVEVLRDAARGKAAQTTKTKSNGDHTTSASARATTSAIHSAVADIIRERSTDSSLVQRTMGILGEPELTMIPGSILLHPSASNDITVRVALPFDDPDIASLRLSVFSEFAPDQQNQFRARSCLAIHNRRLRGAVCVVATMPSKDPTNYQILVGSAECSFDEFTGTRLGHCRLPNSILYVTEVAVNPSLRRRGIGMKLLEAIETVAEARGVESLYLHVDMKNTVAIDLYRKAGYRILDDKPMFVEFTKSLNLHPGATKDREHFLMCKDLRDEEPQWLPEQTTFVPFERPVMNSIGFEIPA
jgi:ribosomal-protein-alanine N-acetyltransferase